MRTQISPSNYHADIGVLLCEMLHSRTPATVFLVILSAAATLILLDQLRDLLFIAALVETTVEFCTNSFETDRRH